MQSGAFGILLEPSLNEFESYAVLNPTTYQVDEDVHLLYRGVRKPNYSSIGYAHMKGPTTVVEKHRSPVIFPEYSFECQGCEDPRVTKIDEDFYVLYTAWDGTNSRIAVAKSLDLRRFEKLGLISPNLTVADAIKIVHDDKYKKTWTRQAVCQGYDSILWDKDAVLFPERFNGQYALLHRLDPDIQIVFFDDFAELATEEFWEEYLSEISSHVVMHRRNEWENEKIGAGAVPVKTDKGWLLIYHGVSIDQEGCRTYHAGAALLDLLNPNVEIARLPQPLFAPRNQWERNGVVNNVVFPEGTSLFGDDLYIYYGAADQVVAWRKLSLSNLLSQMMTGTPMIEKNG